MEGSIPKFSTEAYQSSETTTTNTKAISLHDITPIESQKLYNKRFCLTLFGLGLATLLTAIESTVTSTAFPFISKQLGSGELYVWFVNGFFLARKHYQCRENS